MAKFCIHNGSIFSVERRCVWLSRAHVFECALAAPAPQQERLVSPLALQCRGGLDENAEDRRTIIVSEVDEPRLGNQAAKFDQLARALAALHVPRALIMPRPLALEPVDYRVRATERLAGLRERVGERLLLRERTPHPVAARLLS